MDGWNISTVYIYIYDHIHINFLWNGLFQGRDMLVLGSVHHDVRDSHRAKNKGGPVIPLSKCWEENLSEICRVSTRMNWVSMFPWIMASFMNFWFQRYFNFF